MLHTHVFIPSFSYLFFASLLSFVLLLRSVPLQLVASTSLCDHTLAGHVAFYVKDVYNGHPSRILSLRPLVSTAGDRYLKHLTLTNCHISRQNQGN